MNNYFWIPHIHSEVVGIGPILNPRSLSLLHERIIGIADVTDVALTTDGEKNASLSITIDAPDRMIVTMTLLDSGFCCIQTSPDDMIDSEARDMIGALVSMVNCYLDNTTHHGLDGMRESSIDYSKDFGPVSADNEPEAIVKIVNTVIETCQNRIDYITNEVDDSFNVFVHIGGVMERLSLAESFIESVKDHIPQEYEGLMRTLERYRRCIDNRSSMIRIESDIRRERGQQELNSHTLSINRSVYYLSVLGIGVSMFGASIVADSLISINPLMKAGLISMTSASVVTACWWISKRMTDRRSSGNGSSLSDISRFRSDN